MTWMTTTASARSRATISSSTPRSSSPIQTSLASAVAVAGTRSGSTVSMTCRAWALPMRWRLAERNHRNCRSTHLSWHKSPRLWRRDKLPLRSCCPDPRCPSSRTRYGPIPGGSNCMAPACPQGIGLQGKRPSDGVAGHHRRDPGGVPRDHRPAAGGADRGRRSDRRILRMADGRIIEYWAASSSSS